ncbi:MAG: lipid A 3-O-deacylase [Nitrospinaceae bacterium]|nr:MAG: lipid A 3-O-deacylase [Nitrospinaceae bacterium]
MMKIAKSLFGFVLFMVIAASPVTGEDTHFAGQFKKGSDSFGLQVGLGYTEDLPSGLDRTDITYLFFFPNYQYNLTGLMGSSWYQGAWNWHLEAGVASILNHDGEYLLGASPLLFQYKFLDPKRRWAPNVLIGAGVSHTNWDEVADRELGGSFQFLLHGGVGLEYFLDNWSYSINYRMLHISNAGTQNPNIGLNGHTFALGIQF